MLSLSHVSSPTSPQGLCGVGLFYHVHFTDEEVEGQRAQATGSVYVVTPE